MTGDYLDLLVVRVFGEVPLVEPRLPSTMSVAAAAPEWHEVTEERDAERVGDTADRAPIQAPPSIQPRAAGAPAAAFRAPRDEVEPIRATPPPPPLPSEPVGQEPPASRPNESDVRESLRREAPAPVWRPTEPIEALAEPVATIVPAAVPRDPPVTARHDALTVMREVRSPTQPADPAQSESDADSSPPICIRIDRIDVRAAAPQPATDRAQRPRNAPRVTLDDYLNRRNRGRW